jgi:hypothetical protein
MVHNRMVENIFGRMAIEALLTNYPQSRLTHRGRAFDRVDPFTIFGRHLWAGAERLTSGIHRLSQLVANKLPSYTPPASQGSPDRALTRTHFHPPRPCTP